MTDYFDRVEAHLLNAVERHADRRSRSGAAGLPVGRGRVVRWATAAASVVIVLLVFAGALVIGAGKSGSSNVGTATAGSRAPLVRTLGVLRRPQTRPARAFDQTGWPQPPRAPGSRIRLDRSLIRLATVTPWGARVFVVPLTAPANPALARSLGETVALWVQGIGWSDYSRVADVAAGEAWGPQRAVRIAGGGFESRFFELVPDGVAKVVFYLTGSFPRPGSSPHFSGSVTANVHNNVAVFQVRVRQPGVAFPVYARWYAATGKLLKQIPSHSAPEPTTLDLLGGDGIGAIKFGASTVAVRTTIDSLLGEPGGRYHGSGGDCGIDHSIEWSDKWTAGGLPLLSAYFDRSRFVGYQYGDYGTLHAPRPPARGTVLATTRGLRIGDTLALGKRLYGDTFALSSAQGGTWSVRTASGRIDGYAWGQPRYGDVSPHSVVATIDAGDVGCPALSP